MEKSKNKFSSKADDFIVNTFSGLLQLVLTFLAFVLLIVLPFVFFAMSGASLLSKEWLKFLLYLILIGASYYAGRVLTDLLKNKNEK